VGTLSRKVPVTCRRGIQKMRARRAPGNASASEIRFSDVAHYVGLSLLRDPSTGKTLAKGGPRVVAGDSKREVTGAGASRSSSLPALDNQGEADAEQLRSQMEWLRVEQRAEKDQLKKLEMCLSDSSLLERKAQKRAEKHREMRDYHQQRINEVDNKMSKLRDELRRHETASSSRSRPKDQPQSPTSPQSVARLCSGSLVESAMEVADTRRGGPEKSKGRSRSLHSTGMSSATSTSGLDMSQRGAATAASPHGGGATGTTVGSSTGIHGGVPATPASVADRNNTSRGTLGGYSDEAEGKHAAEETVLPHQQVQYKATAKRVPSSPHSPTSDSKGIREMDEELQDLHRHTIRRELVKRAKGAKKAFQLINLNGSGNICLQEFADGVSRLGVPWKEITGLKRDRELFSLFDQDKNFVIDFPELFPEEAAREKQEPKRLSTPQFWDHWCARNSDPDENPRGPKWSSPFVEETKNLDGMMEESEWRFSNTEELLDKKKWMSSTIRRMKSRGKSDARCREMLALHLPRGNGPETRDGVKTFSQLEVDACKKKYYESINEEVRKVQKAVGTMRDQRRLLQTYHKKLYVVALEPMMRKQEQVAAASSLAVQGFGDFANFRKNKDEKGESESADKPAAQKVKTLKMIAEEAHLELGEAEDLFRDYLKFCDPAEMLAFRAFQRYLTAVRPNRTFADSDMEAWWAQITQQNAGDAANMGATTTVDGTKSTIRRAEVDGAPGEASRRMQSPGDSRKAVARKKQCNFEQFAMWFGNSEVRGN